MTAVTITSTTSATQTIRAGDVLTVEAKGGVETGLFGGAAVAWSLASAGTAAQLVNRGTISASGRSIEVAAGGTLSIDNSGSINSSLGRGVDVLEFAGLGTLRFTNRSGATLQSTGEALRVGTLSANPGLLTGTIAVTNSGDIKTTGTGLFAAAAVDFSAITSAAAGRVTLTNAEKDSIEAADGDAIRGAAGMIVNNDGRIQGKSALSLSADGIDFGTNAGGTVNNTEHGAITGARHGIFASAPVTIDNDGTITGQAGAGVFLATASTATAKIDNSEHGDIEGNAGNDGLRISGLANVTNSGSIEARGTTSGATAEAIAIGGGSIVNSGTIKSTQRAITVDNGSGGNAFAATTIVNSGTIRGDGGQAIVIVDTFGSAITNSGIITGSVTTGSGADTITNSGTISGAVSTGLGNDALVLGSVTMAAIDLGGGSDTIRVSDKATAVLGGTLAGVETIKLGAGSTLTVNAASSSAAIAFGDASAQRLNVASAALKSGDLAGQILDFATGDSIGIKGIGLATTVKVGEGNVVTLSGGKATVTLHFDPKANLTAQSFVLAEDRAGGTLLTLASAATNTPPVAKDSAISGSEDTALKGTVIATDVDGDALKYTLVSGPAHGKLTFEADGSYVYSPDADYNGADSFTYRASDGRADSDVATVALTWAAVNDAPLDEGGHVVLPNGAEDKAFTVDVADLLKGFSDKDGDALAVAGLNADHAAVIDNADGTFTLVPDADFNGTVTLSWRVVDGKGGSIAASAQLSVDAVNDAPHAGAGDIGHGREDVATMISVAELLAGFADIDGDKLSLTQLSADVGTLVDNGDGTFTLTTAVNFNGEVTLTCTVSDGLGGEATGNRVLKVDAVNDAPTALVLHGGTIAETVVAGAFVGRVGAVDVDDFAFTYMLIDDAGGRFAIDAETGLLSVAAGAVLDFETASSWKIAVRVFDGMGANIDQSFVIDLTDVREISRWSGTSKADNFAASGATTGTVDWVVNGGSGKDNLTTLGGADTVNGGGGADVIFTGSGDDIIVMGLTGGSDCIDGGAGFDTIKALNDKTIIGLSALCGVEMITANGFAKVSIAGTSKADKLDLSGTKLVDIVSINGGLGNDTISGSTGADRIDGGSGADLISGGLGGDVLTGGKGKDAFVFHDAAESAFGGAVDHLTDFRLKDDRIDLSGIDANSLIAGDQAFEFIGFQEFTGLGQLKLGYDGGQLAIYANVSGDLAADFELILDTFTQTLSVGHFVL